MMSKRIEDALHSEKTPGVLLILCTIISLGLANSTFADAYLSFWKMEVLGLSIGYWINDGLMAIFFLLIGLELEREIYSGELSNFRKALLPFAAALRGVLLPALIHFSLNHGTDTQSGIGIPMATDIAFALGILAILGSSAPKSLKIFLTALAVIDDLVAILVIAIFYTQTLSIVFLLASLGVFAIILCLNHIWRIHALSPYVILGILMWALMLKSGVHATVAGIILAFAIPFHSIDKAHPSPSDRLIIKLHVPVTLIILPLFALANTGVYINAEALSNVMSSNSLGIIGGLLVGKPLGILLACVLITAVGATQLPKDLRWNHIIGAGLLAGIGFTMSIFITNLAFVAQSDMINASKLAILIASLSAGILGYLWLLRTGTTKHQITS